VKEWTYEEVVGFLLRGVDERLLMLKDEEELKKFRDNVREFTTKIVMGEKEEKEKLIKAAKVGTMQIIASIPVITPVITAMLQVITGEDMDTKMDTLGKKIDGLGTKMDTLGTKMDKMLSLQEKTLQVLDERLPKIKEEGR
jgi:hypothetical protein